MLVAAALVAAAIVVIALRTDVETGGAEESSSPSPREHYCSTLDGDIEVLIEWLRPVAPDQRRAAAATVPSQLDETFVDGAPVQMRAAARDLMDAVDELRSSSSGDPSAATSARSAFAELERTRSMDCATS